MLIQIQSGTAGGRIPPPIQVHANEFSNNWLAEKHSGINTNYQNETQELKQ
ncbi:MAG: hypothetical protein ACI80M_000301 [Gammaproteobacteria bacterium]|jgi:hypothetical protein|tara:strand:+ start:780 stop:932 length:153 start_codon:yes stop_codon:yes gene_type:complete